MYNYLILFSGDEMKRFTAMLSVLALTVVSCLCINILFSGKSMPSNSIHMSRKTVVIDAGHGGIDVGTIGIDKTNEKDINLQIALKLYDYLMFSGINSILIRDGDYEFYKNGETRNRSDLYNRFDYINSIENSVLISIHQNHFSDEREHGTQIWYSGNREESKVLADNILSDVKTFLQPNNERENKQSDNSYYLLYNAKVPSIMIECGFMSNAEENKKLQDENYQKLFSFCILTGISGEV